MKFALSVASIDDLKDYLLETKTDIYILGDETHANRLPGSFTREDMLEAVSMVKAAGKEVYINMNMIIHNTDLDAIHDYMDFVKELDVNGIIFGDLAVYMYARELDLLDRLIYNPDTLNTNRYDPIFWEKKGIKGVTIAKEIIKEEVIDIAKTSSIEVSLIGHGYLNMFHSKRPLIENFLQYNNQESSGYINNRNLTLVEEKRNESYPVFQDIHGTHMMRAHIMKSFSEVEELSHYLDVFIVDTILQDKDYSIKVMNLYTDIIKGDCQDIEERVKEFEQNHDSGFLYKKTVYDKY